MFSTLVGFGETMIRYCPIDPKDDGADKPCGEVGSFTMLPKEKRVHYRRQSSTFWQNQPEKYPWDNILKGITGNGAWVHATGITPMCGSHARARWIEHLQAAAKLSAPVSIDFNHRPALG